VRAAFGLLYNELAWSYDAVSWLASLGKWREWQTAALGELQGQRVLEIAHGPGHVLRELGSAGRLSVGLDLSAAMGRQARRRLVRAGLAVRLTCGRAQALPFAEGSFDSAVATFPAEFIADPATLEEISRVLAPGGRLVIVPEAQLIGRGPLIWALEWLYRLTGQRGPSIVLPEDQDVGPLRSWRTRQFLWSSRQVRLESSLVTVLVAEKPLEGEFQAGTMPA
jgi:ubiquinone/menaquinone biosynthesis C-methylase UbiE